MSKIEKVIAKVEQYTHLIVGAAAVAVSAIDPSTLPPKWAAGVVLVSQGLVVANGFVNKVIAATPTVEADATKVIQSVEGVIKTNGPVLPADPADPNAPKAA